MSLRIAADTGGTFSDVVVTNDDTGELWINKALTTSERVFDGISEALDVEARRRDLTLAGLLEDTSLFIYGTTRSTNAILTGTTAKTAFLTTAGHPDTLVLREGGKLNPFDFRQRYPEPYIPRRLTFEIDERVGSEGDIVVPLDEARVREVAARLRTHAVEAVAVCLLWSIANPAHERRIGEILAAELPGVPVTLSCELNPIIREYRRASSAAIDASLKPLMQLHLSEMANDLHGAGFRGELLVGTSFGGVLSLHDVAARPIYSVNSAPAMAPVAGRAYARDERNVIVCDMGGTSFDVSVVRDGNLRFTRETWLGGQFTGHMTGLSAVDVKNIGAGGGSIAWVDSGGLLRVGPQSAGAQPGPACYGHGGQRATVTDAAVILGYVDPEYFLGGRIALSAEAARAAIDADVAEPLALTAEAAANAILTVANEHMVNAIRDITINEGLDPRESLLIAGGGAGGLTAGRIAEELGCDRVLVPRTAGTLSACGGSLSDIVSEFSTSYRTDTDQFDYAGINVALQGLDLQMDEFFERLQTPSDEQGREFFVEARYPYQAWELEVPLARQRFDESGDVEALVDAFHAVHTRVFAVSEPGQHVECIYWKARATVRLPAAAVGPVSVDDGAVRDAVHTAPAWFGDRDSQATRQFHGPRMQTGAQISGPAVIQEPTTTVVIYPGWSALVTARGEYLMTREPKAA